MRGLIVLGVTLVAGVAAAPALAADPYCTGSYGGATAQPRLLRFGIDPEMAGNGVTQGQVKPENAALRDATPDALRPGGRGPVLRINRVISADGQAGIRRFQAID